METYTRLSYSNRDGKIVAVCKDTRGCSTKPWCVMVECNGFWQQVSKWYTYRGWAERRLLERKAQDN